MPKIVILRLTVILVLMAFAVVFTPRSASADEPDGDNITVHQTCQGKTTGVWPWRDVVLVNYDEFTRFNLATVKSYGFRPHDHIWGSIDSLTLVWPHAFTKGAFKYSVPPRSGNWALFKVFSKYQAPDATWRAEKMWSLNDPTGRHIDWLQPGVANEAWVGCAPAH